MRASAPAAAVDQIKSESGSGVCASVVTPLPIPEDCEPVLPLVDPLDGVYALIPDVSYGTSVGGVEVL